MAETITSLTQLLTDFATNTTKNVNAARLRNFLWSSLGVVPYVAKTSNYTATQDDQVIAVDATSGAVTIALPAVASARVGKPYTIKKTDSSANAVVVDGAGSETIDGDTTQILFTQHAYITIINTGAAWIVTDQRGVVSGRIYVATDVAAVSNTTTETTLVSGTGAGNLTLPANFFRVGKTIRIWAAGHISTTGTPNLTMKVKLGSTVLATTGVVATANNLSQAYWNLQCLIKCQSVGASGAFYAPGHFQYDSDALWGMVATSTTAVNTTIAQILGLTAQWGTADAANAIYCTNFFAEIAA